MRCDRYIALMVDSAEGSITPEGRTALGAHVKVCAACAAAMQEFDAAAPAVHTALADAHGVPSPGFDARVREAVAAGARRSERHAVRRVFRFAFAGALAALIALTAWVFFTDTFRDRMADAPISTTLSVFGGGSIYEPETKEEAAAVEEGLFTEVFNQTDLDTIDKALNGDIEDQIDEMDDASLKTFEELITKTNGKNKSG